MQVFMSNAKNNYVQISEHNHVPIRLYFNYMHIVFCTIVEYTVYNIMVKKNLLFSNEYSGVLLDKHYVAAYPVM